MNDSTVVLIDMVGSSGTQFTRFDDVLTMVGCEPPNTRYVNTWGDALIAVFPSAKAGLSFALDLRFRTFTHD